MSRPPRRPIGASRVRRRLARFPALALLAPLAACSVGPKFLAPDAPVGEKWREAGNPSVKTQREDYRNWWTAYRDPALNRLVEIAYDQNLTLMEAGARVLKARALLGEAIGEFYPQTQQLNGGADYLKLPRSDASLNPDNAINKNFWRVNLGGQAAWELDLWGKFRHGVESADAAYLASIASYDDVLVTLIGDVATNYIAIRTYQAQIAIAQANVVKQKQALQIAQARFKGGATSELDVFQAQNVLAQTQAAVPQYVAQMQKQENALRVLLGEPPETIDALLNHSRGIPAPPPTVAVGIPAELLRRRPDVRAAELQALAQSAQVGMAQADLYPAFSLAGSLGTVASTTTGSSLKQLFTQPSLSFAFGPSFSWPILNYGQITNNVRAQDAELQALLINYKNTVLKAQREVEDGLSGFLQGRSQVGYLRQSVTAASNALTVALSQYQLGTRDFTTVLTAEQNLYQAQNNLAAAQGNVAESLTTTYRALGGGWQIRWGRDFVDASTRKEMRARTNWGELLPPDGQKPTPGLPGPSDLGPKVRPPQW
ncbi:MAG TPA: TolC family protein [Rhodoblastus sp.]|nr:TolC family protein [Rhodoblastus sp.]